MHSFCKQYLQFLWVSSPSTVQLGPLPPGLTSLKPRCWFGLWSHQRLSWGRTYFQALSGYWQSSFPCSCRTKGLIFLLFVGKRLPLAPKHCLEFPVCGLSQHGCPLLQSPEGRAILPQDNVTVLCSMTTESCSTCNHKDPSPLACSIGQNLVIGPAHTQENTRRWGSW